MSQRPYLPTDVEIDIGTVHLTPAITDVTLRPGHTYHEFRASGSLYREYVPGKFTRGIGLAGIYDGQEADDFRALRGAGLQACRLVVDKGQNDRIHAGMVFASDYRLTEPSDGVITVTGAAEMSGTIYIGSGRYTNQATRNRAVDFDTIVAVLTTDGTPVAGTLRVRGTAGGVNWTTNVTGAGAGVYIITMPLVNSNGAARPTTGHWDVSLTLHNYTTDPDIEWGIVKPEGKFD